MAEKLKDVIDIASVKLVIELDDADNDPAGIISSFIPTPDVLEGLRVILNKIQQAVGCGVFVKGNFGSGKSHLLSYLYLLFSQPSKVILPAPLDELKPSQAIAKVIKVSLVKYPADLSLQAIVLKQFAYSGEVFDRDQVFNKLLAQPTALIIDELSEFLRSKPTPSSFYEDIRFLQFLGEFAGHRPFWVIASLQEWIEETGHISSVLFNRIKDRYPVRLHLTSTHIVDIIDKRLIHKKPMAATVIKNIFDNFRQYFPQISLTLAEFSKTYPLHPVTVRFLSGLTPLFSQHRGVIHFVCEETKKILEEPVGTLLTPDVILDHFQDRILEIPEFAKFIRIVQTYYEQQLPVIFPKSENRAIAAAVLKILILTEISPLEKRKTAQEIANILLKKISTLGADINYEFMQTVILEPLVAHQMYIQKAEDGYFINIQSDEGLLIRRQIKEIRELLSDKQYLFQNLCCLTDMPYLPLNTIEESKGYSFNWQNSKRECAVMLCISEPLGKEAIERIFAALEKRLEGYLIILSPFEANHKWIQSLKDSYSSHLLSSIIFWEPRQITETETNFVEEYLARLQLQERYPSLRVELKKDQPAFREMMTQLFFEGFFYTPTVDRTSETKKLGYIPFDKLLAYLFDAPLRERFPYHFDIMSRCEGVASYQIKLLFQLFIKPGKLSKQEAEDRGIKALIIGLLEPLGIVKIKAEVYTLNIDTEHPLMLYLNQLLVQEQLLLDVRNFLKHSKWGLDNNQIDCLLAGAISNGMLVPCKQLESVLFKDIQQLVNGEITLLKSGKTLPLELTKIIPTGSFIWGEVSDMPTPHEQKQMWQAMVDLIRQFRLTINKIQQGVKRFQDYSLFAKVNLNKEVINRWQFFLDSFVISVTPAEGLEQTLNFMSAYPQFIKEKEYLSKLEELVTDSFAQLNQYQMFIAHPALRLEADSLKSALELFKIDAGRLFQCNTEITMSEVTQRWEQFYFEYMSHYISAHEQYYAEAIFDLRSKLESTEAIQCLRNISADTPSITFDPDWWVIRVELEALPKRCRLDVRQELLRTPACSCGFQPGDVCTVHSLAQYLNKAELGVRSFLKTLQKAEQREKIEAYYLTLQATDKGEMVKQFQKLLQAKADSESISEICLLLSKDVLKEIEKAFQGRWHIREIAPSNLFKQIAGRRLRYADLKKAVMDWIGSEEDVICWIHQEDKKYQDFLYKQFKKYGTAGDRVIREWLLEPVPFEEGLTSSEQTAIIETFLKEKSRLSQLENLVLSPYPLDTLLDMVKIEAFPFLKDRLQAEIYQRLCTSWLATEQVQSIQEEPLRSMLEFVSVKQLSEGLANEKLFTESMVPLSLLINKLQDMMQASEGSLLTILQQLEKQYQEVVIRVESQLVKLLETPLFQIVDQLQPVVVVIDAMRYDVWELFKRTMLENGARLKESTLRLTLPTTTENFRKWLGISKPAGVLNGKLYSLFTFAEKQLNSRKIKQLLKNQDEQLFLHFNFIDVKLHASIIDPHQLYRLVLEEFKQAILPVLKDIQSFTLIADHGFVDTGKYPERYNHGGNSSWETMVPLVQVHF